MNEKLNIEGKEISIKLVNEQDYISLTDIAKQGNPDRPDLIIANWLRNRGTIEFLGLWENMHNKDFNPIEFEGIRTKSGINSFALSPKQWIEAVNAKGIVSKAGRYGGTYAHTDIAFSFGSWISASFQYRLITEFQQLRSEEAKRELREWNAGRELARLNYPIQTGAIKETTKSLSASGIAGTYASEADMLNRLVFGMTAKEWKAKNPKAKGNIRDGATTIQNTILANLESFNSELIRNGASREARENALGKMAAFQLSILQKKYLKV